MPLLKYSTTPVCKGKGSGSCFKIQNPRNFVLRVKNQTVDKRPHRIRKMIDAQCLIRLPLSERQTRKRSSPAVLAQFLKDDRKPTVCVLLYVCDTRGAREAAFLHMPDKTVSKITITKASESP